MDIYFIMQHVQQHLDEQKPDDAVNEAVQQVAFAVRATTLSVLDDG